MIRQEAILEIMSFWEGGVTAARLAETLGISREHLQRNLLRSYRERFPSALKSGKGISFVEEAAALRYAPSSPAALMALLRGLAVAAEAGGDTFPLRLSVERVPEPFMNGDDGGDKFQEVTAAIVGRHALQIDYVAKSGPMQGWFSPHAIADVRPRPHARGYVEFKDGEGFFLDLIPSRISAIHGRNPSKYIGPDEDKEWHERIDVEFELDPTLDAGVRAALIEEAGGNDRIVYRGVRRALADYVERDIGVRRLGGNLRPTWCRAPEKD